MATKSKLLQAAAGAAGGAAGPTDDDFANTTLLLQGDTANTSISYNAFSDASGNNQNIAPNGDVKASSFTPYGTGWSNYFDGNSSYLSTSATVGDWGTGDFTVEAWVYNIGNSNTLNALISGYNGNNSDKTWGIQVDRDAEGNIYWYSGVDLSINSSIKLNKNEWTHIAVCRNSGTTTMYVNGQSGGSFSDSTNYVQPSPIGIGSDLYDPSNYEFTGYISNMRLVKGDAVYTSTFTPPTTPLTNVTNTTLLTCQSNRFIDNSSNAHSITVYGNTEVRAFSPFAETNTINGSGNFDGSGDYLSIPTSADFAYGSDDFTVECWVYMRANPSADAGIIDQRPASTNGSYFMLGVDSSSELFVYVNTAYRIGPSASTAINTDTWYHVAYARSSGTGTLYVNGTSVGSWVDSTTYVSGGGFIGHHSFGAADFNGYISDVRTVNGTAVYTSNFTPPTAPLSAVSNTALLTLQSRGANRNIGFIDTVAPSRLITRYGNTTQGSFSPFAKEDGKWANYFDGSSVFYTGQSSDFRFATGDFTLEAWVYSTSRDDNFPRIMHFGPEWNNNNSVTFQPHHSTANPNKFQFWSHNIDSSNAVLVDPDTNNLHEWYHVAVTRDSGVFKLWVNGVLKDTNSSVTSSSVEADTTNYVGIGGPSSGGGNAETNGYISNARIVKGTAVYTSNFTPATEPLTAVSNTTLLTCQSNRFVDNSNSAHTFSSVGTPVVTPFSPFAPSEAYSPTTKGGSGYFDGSGDYLQTAAVSGANVWTIETWFFAERYYVGSGYYDRIWSHGTSLGDSSLIHIDGLNYNLRYRINDAIKISSSVDIELNTWNHVALVADGTNTTMYLNGANVGSYVGSPSLPSRVFRIGTMDATQGYFKGYISDFRFVSGTAVYTSAFTPPTAPLTAVSNTSILCNFANAGVFDGTGFNVVRTDQNTHVENAVKKYGTGSYQFATSGDELIIPWGSQFDFGTGNFTIEGWVYPTDSSGGTIISWGENVDNRFDLGWQVSSYFRLLNDNPTLTTLQATNSAVSDFLNSWMHFALVRDGDTWEIFLNGTSEGTTTISDPIATGSVSGVCIGARRYDSGTSYDRLVGYIDDLRITKGVARYTSNFTPPSAKLPNQ